VTDSPQFLVLHFDWLDGTSACQETYGPWAVQGDESHLEDIAAFMKAWPRRAGIRPQAVTMALCVSPDAWLAGDAVTAAGLATAPGGDCGRGR
jgi:hypothetical protein